jgi:thioredoxin reductase
VYRARAVLLAAGRRGTPRKLDVPGEEQPKVVYRLIDAEQYRGQRVLVVGGGDSALEAAAGVAEQPGTDVTLSYRSPAFSRAKPRNREQVDRLTREGRIRLLLGSQVRQILTREVEIALDGSSRRVPNDAVIVCAGGVLPGAFLRQIGVEVETKHGTV